MAISFNTGTAVTYGNNPSASAALTIPAGVRAGDVVFVVFDGFTFGSGGAETVQVSSTGTTPVIVGSSQTAAFGGNFLNAALFSFVASASDAGKVITGSYVSGNPATWAAGAVAYTGASNAAPVDVSGAATAAGASSSITCPAETTGAAGDWDLQIVGCALGGSAYTGGAGFTQRESAVDGSSGNGAIFYDSNGSVGGAGTGIGGANFANAGHSSWWVGWTVGLAQAALNTATGSLTVTPAFSIKKAEGHVESLTVHPAFAVVKAEAHKQALTVTPQGAVTFSHTGPSIGGSPDRHHHRAGPWGR